jgi:hypothetical protein
VPVVDQDGDPDLRSSTPTLHRLMSISTGSRRPINRPARRRWR